MDGLLEKTDTQGAQTDKWSATNGESPALETARDSWHQMTVPGAPT